MNIFKNNESNIRSGKYLDKTKTDYVKDKEGVYKFKDDVL